MAVLLLVSMGASQRTANFIVETPDPAFAQQVAQAAEQYRRDLAVAWLGKAMPNWSQPCVMTVQAAPHLGAGGKTTFVFDNGEVFGWRMSIQGSPERVLDSVLPHEITHMIFASHFRQPLPRWADEGGATSVEHASEKNKYRQILDQCLRTGRGIAFNPMFAMMDYPPDFMPLYAEGYSLAEYLILVGGRQEFVKFLDDGLKGDDWSGAVQRHYRQQDLGGAAKRLAGVGPARLAAGEAAGSGAGRRGPTAGRPRAPASARAEPDLPRPPGADGGGCGAAGGAGAGPLPGGQCRRRRRRWPATCRGARPSRCPPPAGVPRAVRPRPAPPAKPPVRSRSNSRGEAPICLRERAG